MINDAKNNTGGVDAMLVTLNGRYQNVMVYNAGARWVVTFNAGDERAVQRRRGGTGGADACGSGVGAEAGLFAAAAPSELGGL